MFQHKLTEHQAFFTKLLTEVKRAVPDGAPRIKLRVAEPQSVPAQKYTLKFGSKAGPTDSPAPQSATQSNGSNGTPAANGAARNPFHFATPAPRLDQLERARSASGSVASPTPSNAAPVKNEEGGRYSPAVLAPYNGVRSSSQAVSTPGVSMPGMLPPTTTGQSNPYNPNGYAQSFNHQAQYTQPNPSFESKWRPSGKSKSYVTKLLAKAMLTPSAASDAMITNLSLATHPGLNISRHFKMDLPPSPTMAQQSITINLPSTHYYLQIKPSIAPALMERQHKLFVTSGTVRLHAMPLIPTHPVDQRQPLFEARLHPGVNRIEIELIAALPKGTAKMSNGQDVELEKITVFANLMRA